MIPVQWIDERAVMAYELGAARFLLEHYFAGTADARVRQETQAWLDRARGAAIARSRQTGTTEKPRASVNSGDADRADRPSSPFERLGE